MPILCNYYVTYRCNAACSFCVFGKHDRWNDFPHARKEDVLRNLSALRQAGVWFIDFTGGEPLLHPDIHLFTREASSLGMMTSITTNCLLYPKRARDLQGTVDLLHFSLDSAEASAHNALRGVDCFDAVIRSLEIARSLGERPDILFTATEANIEALPGVYELARKYDLLLLINPIFSHIKRQELSTENLDYLESFGKKYGVYLNPSFLLLRRQGGNDTRKPLCKAVSRVIVISPENELLLPCFHFQKTKLPLDAGLRNVLNSDARRYHRTMQGRHTFCAGCTVNCYFEPSFAYPVNILSLRSIPSKMRYAYHKYLRRLFRRGRLLRAS
ncbi:MAG: radical SAM protein [Bacteroidota bacterium]|nr:radical SAM protein [Bacteroidota bacterium]